MTVGEHLMTDAFDDLRWPADRHAFAHPTPVSDVLSLDEDRRWRNPFSTPASTWLEKAAATVDYGVWLAGRAELIAARTQLHGRTLQCSCPPDQPCHRDILADLADPDVITGRQYGRAPGLTVRRPWASLLLTPHTLGGKNIENRTWSTQYRGPLLLIAGSRIEQDGVDAARDTGFDAMWHTRQKGWLGAAVLTDVHPARNHCCQPWGQAPRGNDSLYHWVFEHPARLAAPVYGTGFLGLRRVGWTNLIRRNAFDDHTSLIH